MENKLRKLFDFQRFAQEPRLSALIEETEERYGVLLDDEDLEQVSAAGDLLNGKDKPF